MSDALKTYIHSRTDKSTPVDSDELLLLDSADSFFSKKLTWANLKASLGVQRFVKSTDTARHTTTTLTNDAHLTALTFEANKIYRLEATLRYADAGSGGIKFRIERISGTTVASSAVADVVARDIGDPFGSFVGLQMASLGVTADVGFLSGDATVTLTGFVVAGAGNGVYAFQWAQSASDAGDVTLLAGSHIVLTRLN